MKLEEKIRMLEDKVRFLDEWAIKDRNDFRKRLAELEKWRHAGVDPLVKPDECEHEWEHCIYGSVLGDDDVRAYCRKCKTWRHALEKKDPPHDELAERLKRQGDIWESIDHKKRRTTKTEWLSIEARKWMREVVDKLDWRHGTRRQDIYDRLLKRIGE